MHTPKDDEALLHALADVASEAIVAHFRRLPGVDNKARQGFDPVTIADRAAEQAMRALLGRERPGDGVFGEEFPQRAGDSGRTWILDPIDGTRAFMMGLPTWGILVALAEGTRPVLGMMCQPVVGERFWTAPDGAFHALHAGNAPAMRLATRACTALENAVVATTSPRNFTEPDLAARFETLCDTALMVRYGTDCYAYALLAAGHVDLVVETGLKPMDIAPFVPLIEKAGGAVTDLGGTAIGDTVLDSYGGEAVAVGDPALLPSVLDRLAPRRLG